MLDANAALEKGQAQILARITLVLNLQSLEDEIMALDRSTDQLDKFARNVTVAHHPGPNETQVPRVLNGIPSSEAFNTKLILENLIGTQKMAVSRVSKS